MNSINSETVLEDVLERYPAARVVLSRYGLETYEEAHPPRESVGRFAENRGIPVRRLLEELDRIVDISLQEPPPSRLPLAARYARIAGRTLPIAPGGFASRGSCSGARASEEGGRRPEGAHTGGGGDTFARLRAGREYTGREPEFYRNEHRKMLTILDGFKESLPRLIEKDPGQRRREIIELFDQGYWFKRLLEHHDNREENILYPVLDRVTDEAERKDLLRQCFPAEDDSSAG